MFRSVVLSPTGLGQIGGSLSADFFLDRIILIRGRHRQWIMVFQVQLPQMRLQRRE